MSDPRVTALLKEEFIGVAASDVEYTDFRDDSVLESQLIQKMFRRHPNGLHQGIYVVTSSGDMLAQANRGWPDPDPEAALTELEKALSRYKSLSKQSRLLQTKLNRDQDRLKWEKDSFKAPKGTLDLRVTVRSYPYKEMNHIDVRHPDYYEIDRLWFKPSEYHQWLPSQLTVGVTKEIDGVLRDRIIYLGHMMKDHAVWREHEFKTAKMTSRVESVSGDLVKLGITANYDLHATNEWNPNSKYTGRMLGRATWNKRTEEFDHFELVMLGDQTLSDKTWERSDDWGSRTTTVASYMTLNRGADADNKMIPSQWRWGYGLRWCTTE